MQIPGQIWVQINSIGIKAEGGGQKLVNVAALEIAAGLGLEMLLRVERELLDRHDQPFLKTSSIRVRCTRLSPRRRGSKEKVYLDLTVVATLPVFTRVQVGLAPERIIAFEFRAVYASSRLCSGGIALPEILRIRLRVT